MPPPSGPKTNGVAAGSDTKKALKPSRAQLKREKKKAKKASAGNEPATGGETETESEMESEAEVRTSASERVDRKFVLGWVGVRESRLGICELVVGSGLDSSLSDRPSIDRGAV